jgi:hypothetical protein
MPFMSFQLQKLCVRLKVFIMRSYSQQKAQLSYEFMRMFKWFLRRPHVKAMHPMQANLLDLLIWNRVRLMQYSSLSFAQQIQ